MPPDRRLLTLPYKAMGASSLRPALSVKLLRLDKSLLPASPALLDSGADCSTFPTEWADKIGIDLATDCEERPGRTAGGLTTNYVYTPGVEAIFAGEKHCLHAVFNPGLEVILLGREDFFAYYQIRFDQRAKQFTLDAYPNLPDHHS